MFEEFINKMKELEDARASSTYLLPPVTGWPIYNIPPNASTYLPHAASIYTPPPATIVTAPPATSMYAPPAPTLYPPTAYHPGWAYWPH